MLLNEKEIKCLFDEIKKETGIDYAITDTDFYGDCMTCVNDELSEEYGIDSKGIYLKHWKTGMNAQIFKEDDEPVYIVHDLTNERGNAIYNILAKKYKLEADRYDESKCFVITGRK